MYIIYVNDIISSIRNCKYYMYADETVTYTTGSIPDCTTRLNTDLSTFKHWCNMNRLTLNVKKVKYTIFGLRSKTRHIGNHELYIDDIQIDRVPTYKYLGVTLHTNLTYYRHLENIIKAISYKSLLLAKMRKYIIQVVSL